MPALLILGTVLLPQLIATNRQAGPASHLTLLLFSLCTVTSVLTALLLNTLPPIQTDTSDTYFVAGISMMSLATIGLVFLTPLYWAVEHFCSDQGQKIDVTLIETLALTFAGGVYGHFIQSGFILIECVTLFLVAVLIIRAGWILLRVRTAN